MGARRGPDGSTGEWELPCWVGRLTPDLFLPAALADGHHVLLELPTVTAHKAHSSGFCLDCSARVCISTSSNTVRHLVRFHRPATVRLNVVVSVLLLSAFFCSPAVVVDFGPSCVVFCSRRTSPRIRSCRRTCTPVSPCRPACTDPLGTCDHCKGSTPQAPAVHPGTYCSQEQPYGDFLLLGGSRPAWH